MTMVGAYPIGRRQPRGRGCPVTVEAPFNGETAEHQCSGQHNHPMPPDEAEPRVVGYWHYCGCGYEWGDSKLITKIPKGEK